MRSRSVARDPDDRGFNLAACRASVKEGQVITVNTGCKRKNQSHYCKEVSNVYVMQKKG